MSEILHAITKDLIDQLKFKKQLTHTNITQRIHQHANILELTNLGFYPHYITIRLQLANGNLCTSRSSAYETCWVSYELADPAFPQNVVGDIEAHVNELQGILDILKGPTKSPMYSKDRNK